MAFKAIKAARPKASVGPAFSMTAVEAASPSAADREAAERVHRWDNTWFLDDPFLKIFPYDQKIGGNVGPKTDMGWEVYPEGLYEIVMRITKDYHRPVIEVTANGCAYGDAPDSRGVVNDQRRIDYYRSYLTQLARAIKDGGFHAWSLLDNFEWAEGYTKPFGIVFTDYSTQKRTVKESGHWFAKAAEANALPMAAKAAA